MKYIAKKPGLWGEGQTPEEALANMTRPHLGGLLIDYPLTISECHDDTTFDPVSGCILFPRGWPPTLIFQADTPYRYAESRIIH